MKLTEHHRQQYRDEGYTVVRGLVAADELEPLRSRAQDFLDGKHEWPESNLQVVDPSRFRNPQGGYIFTGLQSAAQVDDLFRVVANHPNLQAAMQHLLGGPVKPFHDQLLCRYGALDSEQGGKSFYHQDSYYWRLRPEIGCNAWITLNEVGKDAGALAIMPGTHRTWTLEEHEQYHDDPTYHVARTGNAYKRHRIPLDKIDSSNEVLLEMQPGDAVFFTNFTWHRSEPNRTGQNQFAYAVADQLEE